MIHQGLPLLLAVAIPAQQFVPATIPPPDLTLTAALDLDGDGDDDLVARAADGLVVLQNRGAAHFERWQSLPETGIVDRHLGAVGDLDGDGDPDLILASDTGPRLFRNLGGTLAPGVRISTRSSSTTKMLLRDLDRDRDLDLVLGDLTVTFFANDGTGTFTQLPLLGPFGAVGGTLAIADLDGDGADDLVIGNTLTFRLWFRRGSVFVDETAARWPVGTIAHASAVTDVDGDGDVDVVLGDAFGNPGVVLGINDGSGNFLVASLGVVAQPVLSIGTPDLDGDGDRDLVAGSVVLHNDGSGTFTRVQTMATATVVPCNLDGDGRTDLLGVDGIARGVALGLLQDARRCAATLAGDLDGDGDPDLIADSTLWRNEAGRLTARTTGPVRAASTAVADLDGDGDLDLAELRQGSLHLGSNDGSGTFTATVSQLPEPRTLVAAGDFDGDGDADLVLGIAPGQAGPSLRLLRNDGALAFTDVTTARLPASVLPLGSLVFADADLDGDPDLLLGQDSPNALAATLWRNENGMFLPTNPALPSPLGTGHAILAQLDRDLQPEIALLGNGRLHLLDWTNGAWQNADSRLPPFPPVTGTRLVALDVDTDGDVDLMLASGGQLLTNDGNGTFTDGTGRHGAATPTPMLAVDLDGDGDPDLLDGNDVRINRQRQLILVSVPTVGGRLAVDFLAEPTNPTALSIAVVTLGLQRSARGQPWLGGRLFPEPGSSVVMATVVSLGGSIGTASVAIPGTPALRGLDLQIQGLVVGSNGSLALANHLQATIE